MTFESFIEAQSFFLWATFAIALLMGAIVNKTNFCTMGAISDIVNIGNMSRFRAWMLAIAVAVVGVVILEYFGLVRPDNAFPPYRSSQLIWGENLLGGILFGIGMTLASGCGNKTLVRLGGGNLKSVLVILVIAGLAYFMVNPFPGTDKTIFSLFFYDWIRPMAIDLESGQDLGSLISNDNSVTVRLILGASLGLLLLWYAFKSAEFRGSFNNILGGMAVGLAVLAAWYVTSNVQINADGDLLSLSSYYEEWDMLADSDEGKPAQQRPLSPQSFTFINPMGQVAGYAGSGFSAPLLTFGVMAMLGVITGSFFWSVASRSFRIEWFSSVRDFVTHFIGATLMGIGGVLALGCTIGQGVTGISTLATGSFITFGAIVFGCVMTMKIQYYKMVYEEEATFIKALVAALADLKLVPASLRSLEKV